jgi:flavin-dependent dehydrogenase
MGLDVGVVERCRFPRSHVGICISDETLALIDYLGLDHELGRGRFWRRNLTAVKWQDVETRLVPQKGYHLDRALLDQDMLDKARSAGSRVYQPVQVHEVERLDDQGWRVMIASKEGPQLLKARFIVDAAGRRGAIPGARIKDGPPLVALHANWVLDAPAEFDGLIEGGEDAWLWYARTARDRAVVSVFCDPRGLRAGNGVQAKYRDLLRQFRAGKVEQLGTPCSNAQACDATSHHAEHAIGDHYLRVGDACFSVDPLSSQGVHLALLSGLQGAVTVNTVLRRPENTEAAQQFFRMRIAERIKRYTARTKQEYSVASATRRNAFWHERSADVATPQAQASFRPLKPPQGEPSGQVAVSPNATFDAAPVIEGSFVQVREVVRHPNIEGSVAYFEGVDLVRLLSALPREFAYRDIPRLWQHHIPSATASRIAQWLWSRRLLVEKV